jgi:DNA-binding response OmpR family regulator
MTKDIPAVIVSVAEEKELGFSLGAVDYFVKPIDKEAFLKRIANLGLEREKRVLVVDDNPVDVHLTASVLEAEGIRVLRAYGGEEGLKIAKENKLSLIVLDILMSDLSGFEVIERLRSDAKTKNTPVIILTMKELTKEEIKMLRRQAEAIMMKTTFRRQEFLKEVKRVSSLGKVK